MKDKQRNFKLIFILLFVVLGIFALQLPINTLEGSRVKFTLFDLFAPISGAFLGTPFGIVSVVLMQLGNLVYSGFKGVDDSSFLKLIATLRFLPMVFGVWYFAKISSLSLRGIRSRSNLEDGDRFAPLAMTLRKNMFLLTPALAIIAFNLHPIGRTVWYYSLFWLIPYLVLPFAGQFLLARSLGATFTAHAVGGAVWIWAFSLPAPVWVSLIPVVILERSIFAVGISASYILMNNVLGYLSAKKLIPRSVTFDKKYLLKV